MQRKISVPGDEITFCTCEPGDMPTLPSSNSGFFPDTILSRQGRFHAVKELEAKTPPATPIPPFSGEFSICFDFWRRADFLLGTPAPSPWLLLWQWSILQVGVETSPNYTQNFPTVSRGAGEGGDGSGVWVEGMALLKSRRKYEMKKGRFVKGRQVFIKKIVDAEVTEVLLLAQAGGKPGSDWGTASLLWEWWDGWEGGHPCPCKATGGATAPCTQLRSTWVTALTGGRGAGLVIRR